MLTGFLGDVLRFFEPGILGQIISGEAEGLQLTDEMLLVAAVIMVIPIAMALPTYSSAYAIFLLIVGLAFCALIIRYAWKWLNPHPKTASSYPT